MIPATLVNRLRLVRQGNAVERCHIAPHALRYSVGHHTADLLALLILTWQAAHEGELPSANLMVTATFHDNAHEKVTGDIPSQVKELVAASALEDAEVRCAEFVVGFTPTLTEEEQKWLYWCDKLECALWAAEEHHQRGNQLVATWAHSATNKEAPPVFQRLYQAFDAVFAAPYQGDQPWQPLSWEELKGFITA